jgi:transcriptional regulator with XRE-family HTH domain
MSKLNPDQNEVAVAYLISLIDERQLKQTQLEHLSGVAQSEISKIVRREKLPSQEQLTKLFKALGLSLMEVLHSTESWPNELIGYLATPLTGLTDDEDQTLRRAVTQIREIAVEFSDPSLTLYWPGDFTHPKRNPEFSAAQVYRIDRSRASTFDFVVLFCASPSYGVGQENEIATQAGLPAIRLVPAGISRMMSGAFIQAHDVPFEGSLGAGVNFDHSLFRQALTDVKRTRFKHRALFKGMNGNDFSLRLKRLIDDRSGDYQSFAHDLGVNLDYVQAMTSEPFAVTNPSSRLLKRMAVLLNVSVGYLLGETPEVDPTFVESMNSHRRWIQKTPGLDAGTAQEIADEWKHRYGVNRAESSLISRRDTQAKRQQVAMSEADWDKLYQEKGKAKANASQRRMF